MRIFQRKEWSHLLSQYARHWQHFDGIAAEVIQEKVAKMFSTKH